MRAAIIVIPLILLTALLPAYSQSQGAVVVFISGVDFAGTGDSVTINVTVAGGPAEENGTFTLKAYLRGGDLVGAFPLEDSPLERSSSNKTFTFNATMPLTEQEVEVFVEVNSSKDDRWSEGSSSMKISVLVPLRVSADIVNRGAVEVRDVPVFLHIDREMVAETVLESLKPGETKEVVFEYLPVGLSVGTHSLEIWVDFNKNGVIDPVLGDLVVRITFVKEADPINPLWIILGAVGALVAALFVGAAIRRRRTSKK